jgi:preprotein translocase subunit SecE
MPVLDKGKSMTKATALTSEGGTPNGITGLWGRTVDFLRDVRGEMRKVVVPSRKEVQATTTVVIVTVFIFAAYFYLVDRILDSSLYRLLHQLGAQ